MNVVAIRQAPEPNSFDELWLHFPPFRRDKKALCRARWDAITGDGLQTRTLDKDSGQYVEIFLKATPEEIIAAAKHYDVRMRGTGTERFTYKDGGKFCVSLAVWLNQGRFLDESTG